MSQKVLHAVQTEIDSRNIVIKRRRSRRHHTKETQSDKSSVEEHDPAVVVVDPVHQAVADPPKNDKLPQIIRGNRYICNLSCDSSACGDRDARDNPLPQIFLTRKPADAVPLLEIPAV